CTGGHQCPLKEIKRTRQPFTTGHIHYNETGDPIHAEVHGYPILDQHGNVRQMIEYCVDVTRFVKAKEAAERAMQVKDVKKNEVMPITESAENLEKVRILVVDDSEINLKVCVEQLAQFDLHADPCASGSDALACLREAQVAGQGYNAVIMDYMMPEMNGLDLAKAIKADQALRDVVLVMMSSVDEREKIKARADDLISAYLVKPVRSAQLYKALNSALCATEDNDPSSKSSRKILAKKRRSTEEAGGSRYKCVHAHLLVVEDNVVNQKVMATFLKKLGCTFDLAAHGREALARIENHDYDLVLMDCQMPVMDGFEATTEVRRLEGDQKHTTIIAVTANAMKGDKEQCLKAGMDDYLSKPVRMDALYDLLCKYCTTEAPIPVWKLSRVLLVDDDAAALDSLTRIFRKHFPTMKVRSSTNGMEASAMLGSFMPNLVLLDLKMPKMDGLEFVSFIRQNVRYWETRVIMITGVNKEDDRITSIQELGVSHVLSKPFQEAELVDAVTMACLAELPELPAITDPSCGETAPEDFALLIHNS
ncbi:MAG: response regulator, partial [Planctomycetota bacterium]